VYGCTFDPAPRCAGGPVFRRVGDLSAVGKITSEDTSDELAVGRAIMKLPLASNYFALPTERCRPEIPTGDPDESDCRVITEDGQSSKFGMLIMPAAGQQLLKWSASLPQLAEKYLEVFTHLLEGIIIYQDAGFVHNDIHMGNVLVDQRGVARFIDFGLAFQPAKVKEWSDSHLSTRYRPKFMWQAPEIHGWRMRLNGLRISDGAAQLLAQNEEWRLLAAQFPARAPLGAALQSFLDAVGNDGVAFLRRWANSIDCWRIGLMFFILWNDLLAWSGFQQTSLWRARDTVRRVLGGLTEFDPRRRWSARQALAALDPNSRFVAAAPAATTAVASGQA